MLIQIELLKSYLGLPDGEDAVLDPIFERSSMLAQALVEAYLGTGIELENSMPVVDFFDLRYARVLRLSKHPALVSSVAIDSVVVPVDQYSANRKLGVVEFKQQRWVDKVEVTFTPGFDSIDLPKDLEMAMANIALALYNNGGLLPGQAVQSGALKSLTMFDAMSMSFDTDASTAASAPQALVTQWAFVLNRYKTDSFTMG